MESEGGIGVAGCRLSPFGAGCDGLTPPAFAIANR
jgi:hypothetical protein